MATGMSSNDQVSAVSVDKASVRFGDIVAIDAVSLELKQGQRLAVVGESGAGKSTLLNLIAGLISPSEGGVRVLGRDAAGLGPTERSVGLMFQSDALFPHLSVFENVAFPLRARGMSGADIKLRVNQLLDQVGVRDRAAALPRTLSGGQRQRVALARALALRPAILLFDEPLTNLDTALRGRLRELILAIQREAKFTLLLVTHDSNEAAQIGQQVAVLRNGRLVALDSGHALYWEPPSSYVASLFGSFTKVYGSLDREDKVEVRRESPSQFLSCELDDRGKDAISGIVRPELISLREESEGEQPKGPFWYEGTIEDVRDLARQWSVKIRPSGTSLSIDALIPSARRHRPPPIGETVLWSVDWNRVHWLASET